MHQRLRCPLTGGKLELHAWAVCEIDGHSFVETGILLSPQAKLWFPIINCVPVMVVFETPLVSRFRRDHEQELQEFHDYRQPNEPPMPGELSVQETFTAEWERLGNDEFTFVYSDAQLHALHRDVWLQVDAFPQRERKHILDVGCGFGKEAEVLKDLYPHANVVGVDLNVSLLAASKRLLGEVGVDVVIASLFRLPFEKHSFDHVHCQGVLHHTFSTEDAFNSLVRFTTEMGSLFVWVYAWDDNYVHAGWYGMLVRCYTNFTHWVGRPILSRLPKTLREVAVWGLTTFLHPIYKMRSVHGKGWKRHNTEHSVRDIFTPRYAHRHRYNDVISWVEANGFRPIPQSTTRYRSLRGRELLGIGVLGIK